MPTVGSSPRHSAAKWLLRCASKVILCALLQVRSVRRWGPFNETFQLYRLIQFQTELPGWMASLVRLADRRSWRRKTRARQSAHSRHSPRSANRHRRRCSMCDAPSGSRVSMLLSSAEPNRPSRSAPPTVSASGMATSARCSPRSTRERSTRSSPTRPILGNSGRSTNRSAK